MPYLEHMFFRFGTQRSQVQILSHRFLGRGAGNPLFTRVSGFFFFQHPSVNPLKSCLYPKPYPKFLYEANNFSEPLDISCKSFSLALRRSR